MCVIITSPHRAHRPSLADLTLCERHNSHGTGLAWLRGRKVEYIKCLPVAEIHRILAETDGPAIVHFRIASVGGVNPRLCHPFPITHRAELRQSARARSVLFHNGTWAEHTRAREHFGLAFPKREPVSDTRVAASIVARFGFEWLRRAAYCRWAKLDADGIQRIGDWTERDRCHYSNTYWMPRPTATSHEWQDGLLFDDEEEDGHGCEPA